MTTAFQHALTKIKSQQDHLEKSGEKEVRNIVITPLLLSIGWDVFDHEEVHNEFPLCDADISYYGIETRGLETVSKVDYSLRIDGQNLVFIEVKQWSQNQRLTDDNRNQLLFYCGAAGKDGPTFAVLTNGRYWRFYIAPVQSTPTLRQFLPELDIVNDEPNKVEGHFRQFLARDGIETISKSLHAAHKLHRKFREDEKVLINLTKAWNKLSNNRREQERLLALFAHSQNIQAEEEHIKDFLSKSDLQFRTVTVAKKGQKKNPTSFTLADGDPISVHSWPNLKEKFCELMYDRHPDIFIDKVLVSEFEGWFLKSIEKPKGFKPLGKSGIYIRGKGSRHNIKKLCSDLMVAFGYPEDSLRITEL